MQGIYPQFLNIKHSIKNICIQFNFNMLIFKIMFALQMFDRTNLNTKKVLYFSFLNYFTFEKHDLSAVGNCPYAWKKLLNV